MASRVHQQRAFGRTHERRRDHRPLRVQLQAVVSFQALTGGGGLERGANGDPGLMGGRVAQAKVAELAFLAQRADVAPVQPALVDRLVVFDGPVGKAFIEHKAPPASDILRREYTQRAQ